MTEFVCPKSGMTCEIVQWTATHVEAQYHVPSSYRGRAIRAILSTVMQCEGNPDNCEPTSPAELDQTITMFNKALASKVNRRHLMSVVLSYRKKSKILLIERLCGLFYFR